MALTPKQENFCLAYLETGNATEAYRRAYDAENMTPGTINVKACELLGTDKIAVRVAELREPVMQRHNVTVDSLIAELEEARNLAMSIESPAPAVAATMGKAKLCGLDKQVIEHRGNIDQPLVIELTTSAD